MTTDQLKGFLMRRANNLMEWFVGTLEVREKRETEDINAAKLACVKRFCGDESLTADDEDILYLWESTEDATQAFLEKPDRLQHELGLPETPCWEAQEFALVVGLILAGKAVECFKSKSHKSHLLAASLLADATEARDYWIQCRGIDRCRNPDNRVVQVNTMIQDAEKRLWFRGMQSKRGQAGADATHNKPGGSRDKQTQIRGIWATGKYSARDLCAEQECASLDMSFGSARRALQNTPDPNPWPAKARSRKRPFQPSR